MIVRVDVERFEKKLLDCEHRKSIFGLVVFQLPLAPVPGLHYKKLPILHLTNIWYFDAKVLYEEEFYSNLPDI